METKNIIGIAKEWEEGKEYVAVDDVIAFLEEFPSYHYSSLEADRLMANKVTKTMINDFKNRTTH